MTDRQEVLPALALSSRLLCIAILAVPQAAHSLFTRAPQVWQAKVREFLLALGYAPLVATPKRK